MRLSRHSRFARRHTILLAAVSSAATVPLLSDSVAVAQLTSPITNTDAFTVSLKTATTVSGPPLDLITAPGGGDRLYIAGQSNGQVRLFQNNALVGTPFLDVVARGITLSGGGEKGLLGTAFHPNFNAPLNTPGRGLFYTYLSVPISATPDFSHPELGSGGGDHDSVIVEWSVADPSNPTVVDSTVAPREIMRIRQPQSNHNGGALRFGPDNNLYIALGDGGGSNDSGGGGNDGHSVGGNAQDKSNVYGKILRVDPIDPALTPGNPNPASANNKYRVPSSNPFSGATAGVDEIFAYGLRNPFRMSFDRGGTNQLYAGDVGQGAREEVDIITSGGNYGWLPMEGSIGTPPAGAINPIAEYTHSDGQAVIGGFVYRGENIPALKGMYVFGDLAVGSTGRLFYMPAAGGTGTIKEFKYNSGAAPSGQLYSFGEDKDGELYALFATGAVRRILGDQWTTDGSGAWSDSTNWIGAIPGGFGTTANFLGEVRTIANAPATVVLNGNRTVGTLRFNNTIGGAGNSYILAPGSGGTLTLDGGIAGPTQVLVLSGNHSITAPVFLFRNTTFDITPASSTLTITGDMSFTGFPAITKQGAGTLSLKHVRAGSLAVNAGSVKIQASGLDAGTSTLTAVPTVAPAARLDIDNNKMVISQSGPIAVGQVRTSLITGRGGTGFANATWNAPGGISSTSAAASDHTSFAVGYVENSFLPTIGQPSYTSFGGQVVTNNSLLIRYTRGADANLDGRVNTDDVTIVGAMFNNGSSGQWYFGDFDYDGICDTDDVTVLGALYDATAPALTEPQLAAQFGSDFASAFARGQSLGSAVPEPSLLLFLPCLPFLSRRRRCPQT